MMGLAMSAVVMNAQAADKVKLEGAKVGVWTMDFDAAVKLAGEKNLPLMLNFTGSDWCGWCKLMDKNVFAEEEWKAYAKDNVLLVTLDFPNDKSIVPEKYVKRNEKLQEGWGAIRPMWCSTMMEKPSSGNWVPEETRLRRPSSTSSRGWCG